MPVRSGTWLQRIDTTLAIVFVVAVGSTFRDGAALDGWAWVPLGALAVATVAAFPIALVVGRREHRMLLETPVLLPLVWFLPAQAAVGATLVGMVLGTAARLHREGRAAVVDVTVRTTIVHTTSVAVMAVAIGDGAVGVGATFVLMLGLVGLHLLLVLPVPLLRARGNPDTTGVPVWRQLRLPLLVTPLAAATAASVVLLLEEHGVAGLVAYAPVGLVLAGGCRLTSAQRDRRRLDALYELAVDGGQVSDEEEAAIAAQRVLCRALPGATVTLTDRPPPPDRLATQVGPQRWLTVTHRTDGLGPDDADLVAAVGRLAATAGERAVAVRGLERRERVKSALLAAAGHDLQTPLAVQQGLAATVAAHRSVLSDGQVDHMLDRIHANTLRMSRTVSGLVDLERLELGAEEESVDAAAAVARWREDAPSSLGQAVVLELDQRPTPVAVGATFIERIVENLVANAVRHSPADDPVVVGVARGEDHVLLTVDDRGPGVADQDKRRIFEALEQGTEGIRGSVGLGLFIVLRFVEHGGGTIEVVDRDGGGASFRVRLPLVDATSAEQPAVLVEPVGELTGR